MTAPASTLLDRLPALAARLPHAPLGAWPTPLEAANVAGVPILIKREDLSAPAYGGNKIRTLEFVIGAALAAGKRSLWATGAYGSNHVLASVVHAPRHGLTAGAILWPQPPSTTAGVNLEAILSSGCALTACRSIVTFPAVALARRLRDRHAWVMPPGAATPLGALGHASAALELATQLADLGLDGPAAIVLPCGSTCTAAGLLVGTALAAHLGLAPRDRLAEIHAVRVSPWPVTAVRRIARMAARTAALLAQLGGPRLPTTAAPYAARLVASGAYLGRGYGHVTAAGQAALFAFAPDGPALDTTYSAKAAAYLLDHAHHLPRPLVFWATKAAPPLPPRDPVAVAAAPAQLRAWLARCA